MTSDEAPDDFGLRFWTALHPELGVVAWARHPTAGTIREHGETLDQALVALRARWAIEDARTP